MTGRLPTLALTAAVASGATAVYLYRAELGEPHRFVTAVLAVGFFWAPDSNRPLRGGLWLLAVAAVALGARAATAGVGGFPLWAAGSLAGAALAVRGGSRAALYYLPHALDEIGERQRRSIRTQLRIAVAAFFASSLVPPIAPVADSLAAVFFLRYVLLQAKLQGVTPIPISRTEGLVPAQKWIVLLLFAVAGGTRAGDALLRAAGEGALLVTGALLSLFAALIFVLALVRTGWPKSVVRRTSFFSGCALAVVLTAVLARLESWSADRYELFVLAPLFFLVVLPLVKSATRLFDGSPHAELLVPPDILSTMLAPATAMSASLWTPPGNGTLFAFTVLMVVYHLIVAFRERGGAKLYLLAVLGTMAVIALRPSASPGDTWKVLGLSLGLALYAVDRFDRVWRNSRPHERISAS